MIRKILHSIAIIAFIFAVLQSGATPAPIARAQSTDGGGQFNEGVDHAQWYLDHEIEHNWKPDYLDLATGDPTLLSEHGVYEWPFALDSIGWSMQSYQDYGGTPYFHHGMDIMKIYGTDVYNRSGGQVINVENYNPGNPLYWEVAVLDPDGYVWQYHHIDEPTIPDTIYDKFEEYQLDPIGGGFIPVDTYIGDIIEWPVWTFDKQFNHIHLNILAAGGAYVNGFEFHNPLPDTVGPEIQDVGLLQNGQILPGNTIEGDYSLYVQARDLILDDVFYLPPWRIAFTVDDGPEQVTWQFDALPGGADRYAYLDDFYVVPPTCGNYDCRDYYIDLGFIPDAHFVFPTSGGQHTVLVTVSDYAGNTDSQSYTYTITNEAPEADPQSLATSEDTSLDILLSGSDADGDPLTFTILSNPTFGTLSGTAPELTYMPGANYNGGDSFTFVVNDGSIDSDPATVSIEVTAVNDAPLANPQSVATAEDIPLEVILSGSDVDGDPISYTITSTPTYGSLAGSAPDLIYTPTANYYGADSFTFLVNDGYTDSEPAVVTIDVSAVNDAPEATPQSVSTAEDTPLEILLSGTDLEGDLLSYTAVTTPAHGILGGTAPNLSYTPTADYNGSDSFTFLVNDGRADSETAVVSIEVTAVNDAPTASSLLVSTTEGEPINILLSGSDVDGDLLSMTIVISPTHGTLSGAGANLTYTPEAGYTGEDSFSYVVSDGELESAPAKVIISIFYVLRVPVIFK